MSLPECHRFNSAYTYEDGAIYVCPECAKAEMGPGLELLTTMTGLRRTV